MPTLKQDYLAYINHHELIGWPVFKQFLWLMLRSTFCLVLFFRLASHTNIVMRFFAVPIYKVIRILSGVQISRHTKIGGGLLLPHFGTIVLNHKATYGESLTLFHGVTVGAKGTASKVVGVPKIGNNVTLSAGAIILGEVVIGDNATVGAGSVVVKNVPTNAIAVGNPARIIKP
jgi:serine acetyltransferase